MGGPSRVLALTFGATLPRPANTHATRAQVLIYMLMMEERYGTPLQWGLLWYTYEQGKLC